MEPYGIMTFNIGNDQENQSGIRERIDAAQAIIKQSKPDIVFVQDLAGKKGLEKLLLDDVYKCTELPNQQQNTYTAVLWKNETIALWKPPKKFARKEKPVVDKMLIEQRFASITLAGPNNEKLCIVSYHGFHTKPKFHGEGAFGLGEKKKLTRDLLNCLKAKNADAVIIGGSFNLPASETPRESIFKKVQVSPTSTDFYMFMTRNPKSTTLKMSEVESFELEGEQKKVMKHAPVVAKLEVIKN